MIYMGTIRKAEAQRMYQVTNRTLFLIQLSHQEVEKARCGAIGQQCQGLGGGARRIGSSWTAYGHERPYLKIGIKTERAKNSGAEGK